MNLVEPIAPPPATPTRCPLKQTLAASPRLCTVPGVSLEIWAARLQPGETGGGMGVLVPTASAKSESCAGAPKSFPLEVNSTGIKLWYNWIHMVWKSDRNPPHHLDVG